MTIAKSIYCSECKSNYSHHISSGRQSPEIYRNIAVIEKRGSERFKCKCLNCGHEWLSKSSEAAMLFSKN